MLQKYSNEITKDRLIRNYIQTLYEKLLEQNLLKIIKPYSHVQLDHIATLINLPEAEVQAKLAEMILDKVFDGTLDQENNCLILFQTQEYDNLYGHANDTIDNMSQVVDKLFEKLNKVKAM